MDQARINKINEIWEEIHEKLNPIFYWSDDTETKYHYDKASDMIISDNGFSIHIEKDTSELTEEYIASLIEQLETDIILYYRKNYNRELWYI